MMPYRGTCEQTRKMRSVTAVHSTFWLKGTCKRNIRAEGSIGKSGSTLRSGDETSGRIGRKGRTRLRTGLERMSQRRRRKEKRNLHPLMTAEKSGKDGREGWGYNKLSEVGVSQLPAVTETWHYKYAQIEAVTGCTLWTSAFPRVHSFIRRISKETVCYFRKL
jgi:hypothetical protein